MPLTTRRPQHRRISGAGWRYNRYGLYHRFHRRWRRCSEPGNCSPALAVRPGHIGQYACRSHGPVCGCGRTGCVEAIASGRGIAAAAGESAARMRNHFHARRQGDEQAQQLIHRSARTLARPIAILKPQLIASAWWFGGSVGLAEGYLALVETYLAQEPAAFHVDLLAAHYRHDAGLLGLRCWPREKNYDDG
ncbi:ROK family protein [Escherichia coli]